MRAAFLPYWTPTHQAVASSVADALGVPQPPPVNGPVDWAEFVRVSAAHHVGALVRRSQLPDALGAPTAVHDQLAGAARRLAEQRLRNQAALQRFLPALDSAGIEALVVKGLPVAAWAYGDLGARVSADVDLLVPPSQVAATVRTLEAIGFRLRPLVFENDVVPIGAALLEGLDGTNHPLLYEISLAGNGAAVDLHWRVFQNPQLLPLDPWAEPSLVQHVTIGSLVVPTLAPEPAWWFLALHGTKHRWAQLKWLADVPAVLLAAPELADDDHRRRAHERGAGRSTEAALLLSHEVFGLPADRPRPLSEHRATAALVRTCHASLGSPPAGTPPPSMRSAAQVVTLAWALHGGAAYRAEALRQMLLRGGRSYLIPHPGPRELIAGLPLWAVRTARRALRRTLVRQGPTLHRYRLAAEAATELTRATVRLRATPKQRMVDLLGEPSTRANGNADDDHADDDARSDAVVVGGPVGVRASLDDVDPAQQVGWAVRGMGNRLPWHPTCVPRALAAQRMLARRNIVAEIHLGVPDASLRTAHAWVVVGDEVADATRLVGGQPESASSSTTSTISSADQTCPGRVSR